MWTATEPAIIFDFGMQACYIPHYFGRKDKILSVIQGKWNEH
jgi:hypothetical protein